MADINKIPPKDAKRVYRVADLPANRRPARYKITRTDGRSQTATLQKRNRQVLDLLQQGPVYCASPVRLSDIVHILKREIGLEVKTELYSGDPVTGTGDFGIYFLLSAVSCLEAGDPAEGGAL